MIPVSSSARLAGAILALALSVTAAPRTDAQQLLLHQLDPALTSVSSGNAQIFEPAFSSSNGMMVDDFTLASTATLTRIDAAFTSNFSGAALASISGFRISIFTSIAAVVASGSALQGDVTTVMVPTGSVISAPFNAYNTLSVVYTIPVNISLPAGTYFVGIAPILNFSPNGYQSFMLQHFGTGGNNAYEILPGVSITDFRGADTTMDIYGNVAAAPEPATIAAGAFAALALTATWTRRRRARVAR